MVQTISHRRTRHVRGVGDQMETRFNGIRIIVVAKFLMKFVTYDVDKRITSKYCIFVWSKKTLG